MTDLEVCPCTLAPGYDTYCPRAIKHFADGKRVSHELDYNMFPSAVETSMFDDNRELLAISGSQAKYSILIEKGKFRLARKGERGTHILKPKLSAAENRQYSPANEHLTMQIASQVYDIRTAESGLCFSSMGEAAFVCKRFDYRQDGSKIQQEDFASLAGVSRSINGKDFKYSTLSYEDIGNLIKKFVPAWRIEILRYFELLLFNFVFSNGNAHAKSFSLQMMERGDYRLAPAYGLMNTELHFPNHPPFALEKGLYNGWVDHRSVTGDDFFTLADHLCIPHKQAVRAVEKFTASYELCDQLIANSFLSENLKLQYKELRDARISSLLR